MLTATCLLTSACISDHVTPVLHQLHWLLVQRQVEFKTACIVRQSPASLAPTYLAADIHLVSEYSSTDRTLTVPRTHNRFVGRSFAVAGPRLWNSLLIHYWLRAVRWYLKAHLFGIWEITAQCDIWFPALYEYSYLLTYLLCWFNSIMGICNFLLLVFVCVNLVNLLLSVESLFCFLYLCFFILFCFSFFILVNFTCIMLY